MVHVAFTWILFCGINQALTATTESFDNQCSWGKAVFLPRGVMTVVDATDEILRLKIPDRQKIRVTLKTGYLTGNTASELRGRVLFI